MIEKLHVQWSRWGDSLVAAIPQIVQAVLVVIIVLFIDERLQQAVERIVGRRGQRELARLLGRLVRLAVLAFGLLVVLGIFKQTPIVASFVASLGVAGLVIAFALQDITKNFAAGVLLLIQRPFGLDDRIRVGTFEGIVTDVNLRATVLRTLNGHEVLIPNADVYSGSITNLTRYGQRRVDVPFSVPVAINVQAVLSQLEGVLGTIPNIVTQGPQASPPTVVVLGFDKDMWTCEARAWTQAHADTTALTTAINLRLREAVAALA